MKQQTSYTKKELINTAVFFTLVLWLTVYLTMIKNHVLVSEFSLPVLLAVIGFNFLLAAATQWLTVVFRLVLKVTGLLGSLIFGIITTFVFFLILTPIALIRRMMGKHSMAVKWEPGKSSYYQEWQDSENVEKQY